MKNNQSYKDQLFLVDALKRRDPRAMTFLFDNYSSALYGVILRIVGRKEWAEEVLQDVFLQAWEQIEKYDASRGRLYTWLYQLARNKSIDKLRSKENSVRQKTDSMVHHVYEGQEDSIQKKTDSIGFRTFLEQLREEEREVLEWTYYKDYSQAEMAKATGIPIGTIKTRVRSAMAKLRQMLKLENR